MTELEVQKIMTRLARECHLERSLAIKRGIQRIRTKNGSVIAYEIKNNGHRTAYIRMGRISNGKATV